MEDKVTYSSNVAYDVCRDNVQQQQVNLIENHHNSVKIATEVGESKVSANKTKFLIILIIIVVLLLLTLVSTALLVVCYNQSQSEQSTLQSQLDKVNNDITAVLTQLAATRSNVSQMLSKFNANINALTSLLLQSTEMEPQSNCGPGLWWRVAHLNMTDPSQRCPCVWRLHDQDGIRACGRPTGSCATNCYLISNQFHRVCGRVTGYQFKSTDAFEPPGENFDGINITSGEQHNHVWSYVAGHTSNPNSDCPCSNGRGSMPPQSIGNHYYCESGAQTNTNNLLWDGLQCDGNCCAGPGTNSSPSWFSVQLPAPTTDMIEVSICADQHTADEDIPIGLLEIYVQ